MSEFMNPLQVAIYNRLTAAITTTSVYDSPPNQLDGQPESFFPFISIGDDTIIPFDTDDSLGANATITIHIWSRSRGRKEVKDIMGSIYSALHRQAANLVAAGYAFIDCLYEFGEVIEYADGKTKHGVCRYRVTMEKL